MADRQNWLAVSQRLGLRADGSQRKPRQLTGRIDGVSVLVRYSPADEDTGDSTGFYAVLPDGAYDAHRFKVRAGGLKLRPTRYIQTGDPGFDQLFNVKASHRSADYVVAFLDARRREALVEAGRRVVLTCNPPWWERPIGAPEGKCILSTGVNGRASGPAITQTLSMLVSTAQRLAN